MNTRPRLIRSIPFWALVVASAATLAYGVSLVLDKLAIMTVTLTDGSATGVEVYVGQSVALLGSILVGVGVLGLLIALAIAAASTLRPHTSVEVVEPIDWSSEEESSIARDETPVVASAPASSAPAEAPVTETDSATTSTAGEEPPAAR